MSDNPRTLFASFLLATLISLASGCGAGAQDLTWRVSKSSGDVWITPSGAQAAALTSEAVLNPGDTVRTGPNGRVLLVRGSESILVTANSVVGISATNKEELSTTILQQAGTILLEVEKRDVKHFEVSTPYLAAVVKGTQFRVSVSNRESRVDVLRGQVEVTDFKTGQYALVHRDQVARVSAQGWTGLSLSGAGALSPIQQGKSRQPSVSPIAMPKEGVAAAGAQKQVRMAAASTQAESTSAPSGTTSAKEWLSNYASMVAGLFTPGGRRNRGEDDLMLALAFPVAVGFFVAMGAAVLRRKKKQTPKPESR